MRLARCHCAGCDLAIHATRDDPLCHSQIYGSTGMNICKRCSRHENNEIDRLGTNDIPELVAYYNRDKTAERTPPEE